MNHNVIRSVTYSSSYNFYFIASYTRVSFSFLISLHCILDSRIFLFSHLCPNSQYGALCLVVGGVMPWAFCRGGVMTVIHCYFYLISYEYAVNLAVGNVDPRESTTIRNTFALPIKANYMLTTYLFFKFTFRNLT